MLQTDRGLKHFLKDVNVSVSVAAICRLLTDCLMKWMMPLKTPQNLLVLTVVTEATSDSASLDFMAPYKCCIIIIIYSRILDNDYHALQPFYLFDMV